MKIIQARLKFHEYDKVDSLKEFSSHDLLKNPIIAFPKVSGHNLSALITLIPSKAFALLSESKIKEMDFSCASEEQIQDFFSFHL